MITATTLKDYKRKPNIELAEGASSILLGAWRGVVRTFTLGSWPLAPMLTLLGSPTARLESLTPVLKRMVALSSLERDWDHSGAEPISWFALQTALELVLQILALYPNLEAPFIAPLPTGGLQLEWSKGRTDLEVEVTPGGQVSFCTLDLRSHELTEGPDVTNLRKPLMDALGALYADPVPVAPTA